jgi:hypothetical protein
VPAPGPLDQFIFIVINAFDSSIRSNMNVIFAVGLNPVIPELANFLRRK